MQRFFIIAINCVLLVAALIGVPEVAGVRFWRWQISSVATAQTLMLWGLAVAAAGNAAAARFLLKGRKERRLCWQWAAIFGALLGVEFALVRGWLNLHWLQRALLWLQKQF
jgi:hypothetical protein